MKHFRVSPFHCLFEKLLMESGAERNFFDKKQKNVNFVRQKLTLKSVPKKAASRISPVEVEDNRKAKSP